MKTLYAVVVTNEFDSNILYELMDKKLVGTEFLGCWGINPEEITAEVRVNAISQIGDTIEHFIKSDKYKNIVFGWEKCGNSILDELLAKFNTTNCQIKVIKANELKSCNL